MKLKNKVAIITGGGTGIGKAIAYAFVDEGATVVIAARNLSRLEQVVEAINIRGGKAKAIETDIAEQKQVQRMVLQTLDINGKVDILVNNAAAVSVGNLDVVDMILEKWKRILDINLTGPMLCSREVLKYMIPGKSGTIINIGSVAGISGSPGNSSYCVSKWGLIGLTETMAIEVGKYNIRVNCISPAATRNEVFENVIREKAVSLGISYEDMLTKVSNNNSLKRVVEPSEIASCAVFLASDDSSAVTGQNLIVSAGFHLVHPNMIE